MSPTLVKTKIKEQRPIFYPSRVLQDARTRYSHMEKFVYAIVISSKKLKPYFKSHTIEVVMMYPLQYILHKVDLARHMALWAIELGSFDMKSQVIFYFINKLPWHLKKSEKKLRCSNLSGVFM